MTRATNYRKQSRRLIYRAMADGAGAPTASAAARLSGRIYPDYRQAPHAAAGGPYRMTVVATVLCDAAETDRQIAVELTPAEARDFAARLIAAADDCDAAS